MRRLETLMGPVCFKCFKSKVGNCCWWWWYEKGERQCWKPWWGQSAVQWSQTGGGQPSPFFSEVSLTKDWVFGLLCTPAWNCDLIDLGDTFSEVSLTKNLLLCTTCDLKDQGDTLGRASRKRLLAADGQAVKTLDQLAAPPYPVDHLNSIYVYSTLWM